MRNSKYFQENSLGDSPLREIQVLLDEDAEKFSENNALAGRASFEEFRDDYCLLLQLLEARWNSTFENMSLSELGMPAESLVHSPTRNYLRYAQIMEQFGSEFPPEFVRSQIYQAHIWFLEETCQEKFFSLLNEFDYSSCISKDDKGHTEMHADLESNFKEVNSLFGTRKLGGELPTEHVLDTLSTVSQRPSPEQRFTLFQWCALLYCFYLRRGATNTGLGAKQWMETLVRATRVYFFQATLHSQRTIPNAYFTTMEHDVDRLSQLLEKIHLSS